MRVSKIVFYNIQIVTGSKLAFFKMIGDKADKLKDIIVWDKTHGQPAMQANVLNRRTELILVFAKENAMSRKFSQSIFARGTLDDIWQISRGEKFSKEHGASFPLELSNKIIHNFSNVDDIVYDPFTGTGTVAVSCLKSNRKYIGSEISLKYYNITNERIALTKKELQID
jgi:site-specific DNA-methyltransferase (adenine-specific)/modification methylase